MFKDKAERDLQAEGQKVQNEGKGGLAYKCLPYIDQTKVGCYHTHYVTREHRH